MLHILQESTSGRSYPALCLRKSPYYFRKNDEFFLERIFGSKRFSVVIHLLIGSSLCYFLFEENLNELKDGQIMINKFCS